jgi:flagellar biosynthesis protein FlhG
MSRTPNSPSIQENQQRLDPAGDPASRLQARTNEDSDGLQLQPPPPPAKGVHITPDPLETELNDESSSARGISRADSLSPFTRLSKRTPSRVRKVWAIGGGKGGVGKSLISSNLALTLAKRGLKTIAIDLDLGGANLHTTLGVELPKQTLSDLISGRASHLENCLSSTPFDHLQIVSGAGDAVGAANLPFEKKRQIIEQLRDLPADAVILDLGAGTSFNTLDFFIAADAGIVVLLPEPTSIENAYRFIKSVYFRKISLAPNLAPVRNLIEMALDPKNSRGIRSPADLYREVQASDPNLSQALKDEISRIRLDLIVNQARTQTDVDIGYSVKSVCKKYFGLDMEFTGYLDYDSAVWQAVRRKRPLLTEFPHSRLVNSIDRITDALLSRGERGWSLPI